MEEKFNFSSTERYQKLRYHLGWHQYIETWHARAFNIYKVSSFSLNPSRIRFGGKRLKLIIEVVITVLTKKLWSYHWRYFWWKGKWRSPWQTSLAVQRAFNESPLSSDEHILKNGIVLSDNSEWGKLVTSQSLLLLAWAFQIPRSAQTELDHLKAAFGI